MSVENNVVCEEPTETEFFDVLSTEVEESNPALPAA